MTTRPALVLTIVGHLSLFRNQLNTYYRQIGLRASRFALEQVHWGFRNYSRWDPFSYSTDNTLCGCDLSVLVKESNDFNYFIRSFPKKQFFPCCWCIFVKYWCLYKKLFYFGFLQKDPCNTFFSWLLFWNFFYFFFWIIYGKKKHRNLSKIFFYLYYLFNL